MRVKQTEEGRSLRSFFQYRGGLTDRGRKDTKRSRKKSCVLIPLLSFAFLPLRPSPLLHMIIELSHVCARRWCHLLAPLVATCLPACIPACAFVNILLSVMLQLCALRSLLVLKCISCSCSSLVSRPLVSLPFSYSSNNFRLDCHWCVCLLFVCSPAQFVSLPSSYKDS